MNCFSTEYLKQSIQFMNLPAENLRLGVADFVWKRLPIGRLNEYLNVQFNTTEMDIPVYLRDNQLWMSITSMEVQSAVVPIARAAHHGKVACGGLGMGYVPLKMAAQAIDCQQFIEIDVYELSQDCIDLFLMTHSGRPELECINIIQGDMRELLMGKEYDYVYNDIYQSILPNEVISDLRLFINNNDITEYRYWGQELAAYLAAENEELIAAAKSCDIITFEDSALYIDFYESESSNLRAPSIDEEFCEEALYEHCILMGANL